MDGKEIVSFSFHISLALAWLRSYCFHASLLRTAASFWKKVVFPIRFSLSKTPNPFFPGRKAETGIGKDRDASETDS